MKGKIDLKAGQLFGFALYTLKPPYEPSGYFGVCQVIRVQDDGAVLAGLKWSGDRMPELEQAATSRVLRLTQGPSRGHPAIYWRAGDPPEGFEYLGLSAPSAEGIALTTCNCTGRYCRCRRLTGGWNACRASLQREWRWRRDPQGYEADFEWLRNLSKKSREKRAQERKEELARATLQDFREETLFPGWEEHLAPTIVEAGREIFRKSVDKLETLGPTAAASEKIEVLRWATEEFNRLNVNHDLFIETGEREAICGYVEKLARAAGIEEPDLADRWREW
ncbi:MAG: hypothetical protein ACLFU8_16940 [Anaerolineales bacterium]